MVNSIQVRDLLLRHAMLEEWRADHYIIQATRRIRNKFGFNSVTKIKVCLHFDQFNYEKQLIVNFQIVLSISALTFWFE